MNHTQTIRRRTLLAATLAVAASASTACGLGGDDGDNNDDGDSNDDGDNNDDSNNEEAPQSGGTLRQEMLPVTNLDPAIGGGASFGQIVMRGLMEGLVVPNEDGTGVLGGVAEEWEISDDLLTYTFHLRADATWSNGEPVTAQDLLWNWKRILTPGIAGEANPSYTPDVNVAGAVAFMSGETDNFDEVGVKALDEATLEITLEAPNPDLIFLLAQSWAMSLHPATVEEYPDSWSDPVNWVSNGAFVLESFRVNSSAVLVPNDQYWDADSYHIDEWEVAFSEGGATTAILSYQNNEVDVTNVGTALNVIADDPELEAAVQQGPLTNCAALVLMTSRNSPLEDVRIRKALSLSINREQIAEVEVQSVGASLVPSGVPESDQIPVVAHDPEQARQLLSDAGYPDGEGMPTITILNFVASALWLEVVTEMWRNELGLEATIDQVELSVFLGKRQEIHSSDYVGFYHGSFGVIPPTLNRAVTTPGAGLGPTIQLHALPADAAEQYLQMQDGGASGADLEAFLDDNVFPEFQQFRSLVAEATAETDPELQQDLLVQAAIAREEAHIILPGFWGGYSFLVRPSVQGLQMFPDSSVFSLRGVTIEE